MSAYPASDKYLGQSSQAADTIYALCSCVQSKQLYDNVAILFVYVPKTNLLNLSKSFKKIPFSKHVGFLFYNNDPIVFVENKNLC